MAEASHKQQAFLLLKFLVQILLEALIDVKRNILDVNLRVDVVDQIPLHVGGIISHIHLFHQRQLHGTPVVRRFFNLLVPGDLVLPRLPEEMEVVAEIQHFNIRVFFNKVNILHRNVGAVQVGEGDVLSMLFQPVPDAGAVGFPVENLNAHLFQGRGVGLLMGIVVPQEFHHKALFHKHLHVLVGTFGSGVLVEGGNVVVHH